MPNSPSNTARVKANIETMIRKNASEREIDTYIASEGVTAQGLRAGPKRAGSKSYTVRSPDGATYTVTAPEGASEAEVMARVQAQHRAQPKVPAPTWRDNARGGAGRFLDGILPGTSATIRGARGAVDNAIDYVRGRDSWHPGRSFDEYSKDQKAVQQRFSKDHPNVGDGLGWAGFAGGLLAPSAKVVKGGADGLKLGGRMVNGAANGALWGTAGGALNDTGEGRLANARNGAIVGGTVGAVVPAVTRASGAVLASARRNIPGADALVHAIESIPSRLRGLPTPPPNVAAKAQAERLLAQRMNGKRNISTGMGTEGAQATPQNVLAEVQRRHALGVPAAAGDTSHDLRRTTAWALAGNGPMATRARKVLAARQAQQAARVRSHLTAELGPAVDPIAEAQAIQQRASDAAKPGYAAAYAQPMVITDDVAQVMKTPAFRDALPQAVENIQNSLGDPQALGFRLHGDGSIQGVENLSTEGFDQVIRAMKGNRRAAMDTSGFVPRDTTNSVHIGNRARDLQTLLGDQNPAYRDVTSRYADEMAIRDALAKGGDIAKLSGPEIEAQLRDIPQEHAREAWTAGARSALADEAIQAGLKPTTNVPQRIRQMVGLSGAGSQAAPGDPAKLQAFETMAGQPGVMNRLDDRLEAEHQAYNTFAETFGNGKTAGRGELGQMLGAGADTLRTAAHVAHGNWPGAIMSMLFKSTPAGTMGFRQAVQDHIAGILTETNPQSLTEAMQAVIDRRGKDEAFRNALDRVTSKVTRSAMANGAAISTDPVTED